MTAPLGGADVNRPSCRVDILAQCAFRCIPANRGCHDEGDASRAAGWELSRCSSLVRRRAAATNPYASSASCAYFFSAESRRTASRAYAAIRAATIAWSCSRVRAAASVLRAAAGATPRACSSPTPTVKYRTALFAYPDPFRCADEARHDDCAIRPILYGAGALRRWSARSVSGRRAARLSRRGILAANDRRSPRSPACFWTR